MSLFTLSSIFFIIVGLVIFGFIIILFYLIEKSSRRPKSPWNINIRNKKILGFLILLGLINLLSDFRTLSSSFETSLVVGLLLSIAVFGGGVLIGLFLIAIYNEVKQRIKK